MKHDHENGLIRLNTWDYIKHLLFKNKVINKRKLEDANAVQPTIVNDIAHIALVIDGEVKDILRAQNKLAAIFLSNPEFVEFDIKEIRPNIGWKYDGVKLYEDVEKNEED